LVPLLRVVVWGVVLWRDCYGWTNVEIVDDAFYVLGYDSFYDDGEIAVLVILVLVAMELVFFDDPMVSEREAKVVDRNSVGVVGQLAVVVEHL
jgi:hypothetical protein